MTKKIFSLLLVSFATCAVMAQLPQRVEGNPDQRNDELMRFAPMEKQSAASTLIPSLQNFLTARH